jgi:hypothetical protein
MKTNNPFDRALEVRRVPEPFLGAAVDVTDTLDLAWASAQSVFGELAAPQQAIAIAELMLRAAGRLDASSGSRLSQPQHTGTDTSGG